nr:DUF2490 domain-containing protein [uncultured Arsenicibacter sp.]
MNIRLLFLCLLICTSAQAQRWVFYGLFPQYSQTGGITKRLSYNVFASSTISAIDRTIEQKQFPATNLQIYLQPSLHYKVSPNVQVGLGYAYVKHNLFGIYENENRVWAQAVAGHALGAGRLTHRLRYEERYPLRVSTQQWSYATLFRYHVGFTLPLYDQSTQKQGLYLTVANEAFLCLTGAKNGPVSAKNAFYGEDWVSGGIGYNTGKWGKIELGYMFQDLIRNPAQDHRHLHLAQINWSTAFNFDALKIWMLTPPN